MYLFHLGAIAPNLENSTGASSEMWVHTEPRVYGTQQTWDLDPP